MVVKITELDNGYEVEINGVPMYVFSRLSRGLFIAKLATALKIPESCFVIEKQVHGEVEDEGRYWPG